MTCSLFWAGTTFLSAYTLQYYQFNGTLPGYDKIASRKNHQNIDPDKAAFSMAPHDEESYAPIHADEHEDTHGGAPYNADSYTSHPMFDSETDYRPHGSAAPGNTYDDHNTGTLSQSDPYSSGYGSQPAAAAPQIYAPPSAEDYDDSRPAQFPTANYHS